MYSGGPQQFAQQTVQARYPLQVQQHSPQYPTGAEGQPIRQTILSPGGQGHQPMHMGPRPPQPSQFYGHDPSIVHSGSCTIN